MRPARRPEISLSQNFLKNPRLVAYLITGSSLGMDDVVYEIGPGHGIITERLATRCRRVIAVEKDPGLAAALRGRCANLPNVEVRHADALDDPLPDAPFKVFANPPFGITAALVTKLVSASEPPHDSYLVMQREAAERFSGAPAETLPSLLLKPWFEAVVTHRFEPGDFVPAPRVDVVMLRLRTRGSPLVAPGDWQAYRDFVSHVFTAWTPALATTLRGLFTPEWLGTVLRRLEIGPELPPSALAFELWLSLHHLFRLHGSRVGRERVGGAERRLREHQSGIERNPRTR